MKNWGDFSLADWRTLAPIRQCVKQARNDAVLSWYDRSTAADERAFIARCKEFSRRNFIAVVAFEQPVVIEWLLEFSRNRLTDVVLLVFDNSRHSDNRERIRTLCLASDVPYLALPSIHIRHPNRSHGLAMTWIYRHLITKLEPAWFGFLDHDMIPVRPIGLNARLDSQDCYGLLNDGHGCWNLWAGYCFFAFSKVANLPMNFLYDFSRGLDTGGRNWDCLYRTLDRSRLAFARSRNVEVSFDGRQPAGTVLLIDDSWFHLGGVGYGDPFRARREELTRRPDH